MKAARPMSKEMVAQLFVEFKKDQVRWTKFRELEFPERPYSAEHEEPIPGRMTILREFVKEKLGSDHGYTLSKLMILVQKSMHGFE
jgi:hypothetical protein